jgi:O-succinylbenzoate synthase
MINVRQTTDERSTPRDDAPLLQLDRIELIEIELPLRNAFRTSFGVTTKRRVIIVRVTDKSGAAGFGECTAMEQPLYNEETVDTARSVIMGTIVPILGSSEISHADDVRRTLSAVRGNRMAVAAVETAVWDLESKLLNKPLSDHLGGTLREIACGVSIGLQESPAVLIEKVARELAAGYQRIKIKIMPGEDVELVSAVRREFPDIILSVDANSAYRLRHDLETMRRLDDYGLLMIEQPLAAGDLWEHSKLQRLIETPICLDESITCSRDARQALEMGACQIINIKLGRVGGHAEARKIQQLAKESGIPVWCGGMLETGIGRAHNIAMSTLDGFSLPGDVSSSERYWEKDIISPPVSVGPEGTITVPTAPGIGYEVDEKHIKDLTTRSEVLLLRKNN